MNILFLGAGRRVELVQAFRRAALAMGKDIVIYGEDTDGTAPALAYCDRRLEVCAISEPGYIEKLMER